MLFATPRVLDAEADVIAQIDDLRDKMRLRLHEPGRWAGSLRRAQFARAVQGSNSIEGYEARVDDALAIDLSEPALDASEKTTLAIKGYRDAMTYVLHMTDDPRFEYSEQLIKSLHFMMTSYSLNNRPGRWRSGTIYVRNDHTGDIVYEGTDVDDVPSLMQQLVEHLNNDSETPALVRAAMAHLNLVLVRPFRDGNGRMARCVQTLVLAREGVLSPVFCSIEEYLGRNTQPYYDVLAHVGGGSWLPQRDARPWLRFCLTAHLRQARTTLVRIKESERLWLELERLTARHKLPERSIVALYDAADGFRVRNGVYRKTFDETDESITDQVASRDLKQLSDAKLLVPHGERRGRYYTAGNELSELRAAIRAARDPRDDSDPFAASS